MMLLGRSRGQPAVRGGWKNGGGSEKIPVVRERTRSAPVNLSMDIDIPNPGSSRCSLSSRNSNADENEFPGMFNSFGSVDIISQGLDFSSASCSPKESSRQSAVSCVYKYNACYSVGKVDGFAYKRMI